MSAAHLGRDQTHFRRSAASVHRPPYGTGQPSSASTTDGGRGSWAPGGAGSRLLEYCWEAIVRVKCAARLSPCLTDREVSVLAGHPGVRGGAGRAGKCGRRGHVGPGSLLGSLPGAPTSSVSRGAQAAQAAHTQRPARGSWGRLLPYLSLSLRIWETARQGWLWAPGSRPQALPRAPPPEPVGSACGLCNVTL